MTDNDPSMSLRSRASDMRVSKLLIRQAVHEYIWYFSDKMRKGQFLSQAMMDERKDHTASPPIPESSWQRNTGINIEKETNSKNYTLQLVIIY